MFKVVFSVSLHGTGSNRYVRWLLFDTFFLFFTVVDVVVVVVAVVAVVVVVVVVVVVEVMDSTEVSDSKELTLGKDEEEEEAEVEGTIPSSVSSENGRESGGESPRWPLVDFGGEEDEGDGEALLTSQIFTCSLKQTL